MRFPITAMPGSYKSLMQHSIASYTVQSVICHPLIMCNTICLTICVLKFIGWQVLHQTCVWVYGPISTIE